MNKQFSEKNKRKELCTKILKIKMGFNRHLVQFLVALSHAETPDVAGLVRAPASPETKRSPSLTNFDC